jgi:hypothetical protein
MLDYLIDNQAFVIYEAPQYFGIKNGKNYLQLSHHLFLSI